MRSDEDMKLKSWQRAIIYLIVWLAVIIGLKLLADVVLESILLHIAFVMILLPAANLIIPFLYTRKCGIKPWLIAYMAAAVIILYFFCGFKSMSPNFMINCLLTGFFGFGIGNIFKDEAAVAVQEDIDNEKKKQRLAEEKAYVSLIDSDPKTGKKADIKKQNKKKHK